VSEAYSTQIEIAAPPEVVYSHFTDPARLVRWMGDRATLQAVAGGVFHVDINGVLIRGHFISLDPGRAIEIAWGELGNAAMPPGSTRLLIEFAAVPGGTRVSLTHLGLVAAEASKHAIGWPHFLSRLAILAPGGNPGSDPWAASPAG
jgi:uncharacterized protein YndB with AHSA1/START domain